MITFSKVISIIKKYEKTVLSKKGIRIHFTTKNTTKLSESETIVYGKNNAYCLDDKNIYLFTKEFYDSPEAMALCFSHEVCHIEDFKLRKFENEFADELKTWGRTLEKLYKIFKIFPTKKLQDIIVKSLTDYNKLS